MPKILAELSTVVSITPVDEKVVLDALSSGLKDFEDAVQLFSAVRTRGIDFLLTRNAADFSTTLISVETPEPYLLGNP